MSNISQSGTYRGLVLDRGLSNSSGGHLQLEVTMQATEKYDEENQVWTPFNYEDNEAQAYLNLITSKEKENAINCRSIMRAFGWDGMSFSALNTPDNGLAMQIQWRMGMEEYNGVERCKVQGVAAFDAAPGRKVEKLDAVAVRALDAKYAGILKNLGGGPKPKTATPKAPAPAPVPAVQADPTSGATSAPAPSVPPAGVVPAQSEQAMSPSTVKSAKRGRKPRVPANPPVAPPTAPIPVPAMAETSTTTKPMDQGAAWEKAYNAAHNAGKTDLDITNNWVAVINEIGGDEAVGADWSSVAAKVLAALGV